MVSKMCWKLSKVIVTRPLDHPIRLVFLPASLTYLTIKRSAISVVLFFTPSFEQPLANLRPRVLAPLSHPTVLLPPAGQIVYQLTGLVWPGHCLTPARQRLWMKEIEMSSLKIWTSVADPDPNPDPSDPYVFGPPGSGCFYHKAKIRGTKNLDSYCLVTPFRLLYLKNYVNVPSKRNKQKNKI